ncbi:MAG: thioredoxin-disulfide reductase [Sneathiella sp.]|nr:thioredoxin-disulfide reductase [Sneathiella sp.]
MAETHYTNVLIIGSGPAGCTAAVYAARAALNPIMVHGIQPGGQLTITTDVENYPGFADPIQGPWLMEQMEAQAKNVGALIHHDVITNVDMSKRPYVATADSGATYIADTIIISTGASAKWLGLPSEEKYMGFGVSACATCDGFFYRGKEVLVIGGGNTAVEEALYLTNHADKVTIVHRRDQFRAEKILIDRLHKNPKIEVIWDHVLDEIIGIDDPFGVTGARLKNAQSGETKDISVHGVFIAIGHNPNTELFKDTLEMDSEGYLITAPDSTATNIPGIYACGDVQDKIYKQAVTAAGTGCMAALEVERFLSEQEDDNSRVAAE